MVRLFVLSIRLYRLVISPFLGQVCRFHPSCSHYAEGCLLEHGLLYGTWLTLKRLGKCHPFHPGGLDPIPPKRTLRKPEVGEGRYDASPSSRFP